MRTILLLSLTLLLLQSCTSDGDYVVRGNHVCYTYWTFSFGYRYDTLPGADPATFQKVNGWLGRDSRRVYFEDTPIPKADPRSVVAVKYPLCRDKRNYYYEGVPMHVYHPNKFKIIKWIEDDFWARDDRYVYYDTIRLSGVHLKTFRVKAYFTAIDKNHVYQFGRILPDADPVTYQEDWKGMYSRDKSHIWYCGDVLQDVDYATFDVDEQGNGFDRYGKFRGALRTDTIRN